MAAQAASGNLELVSQVGPFRIDWPRSIGFYGGLGLAVALGVIEPPVGIFIAAVPFLKMLNQKDHPVPARAVGQVLEGMAKPVGGDAQAAIQLTPSQAGQQG